MTRLLPHRDGRRGEIRIGEVADGNGDVSGKAFALPIDGGAVRSTATRQFWLLIPIAFAVLADTASARSYLNCPTKKVVIVDAPNGSTTSSMEEILGFWIDEAAKVVTLADGKRLIVRRFDDRWISAASDDASYELDRQNGNLTYASSAIKDGIATTTVGAGRCTVATVPVR